VRTGVRTDETGTSLVLQTLASQIPFLVAWKVHEILYVPAARLCRPHTRAGRGAIRWRENWLRIALANGGGWLVGSIPAGLLYAHSRTALIAFSLVTQSTNGRRKTWFDASWRTSWTQDRQSCMIECGPV